MTQSVPNTAKPGSDTSFSFSASIDTESRDAPDDTDQELSVAEMVHKLSLALNDAIGEISAVNAETKLLSLNARIEAARAGEKGAAFGVVAGEMQSLSNRTELIAEAMSNQTRQETAELMQLIDSTIRGTRLGDLALMNIDLIDRNLYERTCDVRWWATDGSLVDALSSLDNNDLEFASKRLGVILNAYTVYHDLALCDRSGRVVANGRPKQFASVGMDQSNAEWFREAMATKSGDEYGFQSAHRSKLVCDKKSLIYTAAVRQGGEQNGAILGALGIIFDWPGLANPVLQDIPVLPSEKESTQAFIIDDHGTILASRGPEEIGARLELPELEKVFASDKGFYVTMRGDEQICVGHAKAPGFETYSTGWYSIVLQPILDQVQTKKT